MTTKKIDRKKSVIIVIIIFIVSWIAIGLIDFFRVSSFDKPIFCRFDVENSFDDGGSGKYNGLGYSFDIMGNFMPEDEYPGVIKYTYYIFGSEVLTGIRE